MGFTAKEITEILVEQRNEEQSRLLMRFFKTGKGEYGEGDRFLGLKVPQTRLVVKEARGEVSLAEISVLLHSPWHEVRLCGFLLLVEEMKLALPRRREQPDQRAARRREIVEFYLAHAHQANNWDLVDLSCEYILGEFLLHPGEDGELPAADVLYRLSESENLWERRISIVSTLQLVRARRFDEALQLAEVLLADAHDLIHKAVGWVLREVGKRDVDLLRDFLDRHVNKMPRTSLRYAIERMSQEERGYWMKR